MDIANLEYAVVLDSDNLSGRSRDCFITGGLGFSQLLWFVARDESALSALPTTTADSSSFGGWSWPSTSDETHQIEGLRISEISVSTDDGMTSRSVAGSGFIGDGRFSFASSSASISL